MTSKILKEMEEHDELRLDNQRIKEFKESKGKRFMEEINMDDNKRLDELHMEFLHSKIGNISEVRDLQLVKMVFDFLKANK